MVAQKQVMLSVGEEKCISKKAGENNLSISDEAKTCVSFSVRFFQIYFILFQTLFSYFFSLEFYWLYFQLIYSAWFFCALSFLLLAWPLLRQTQN